MNIKTKLDDIKNKIYPKIKQIDIKKIKNFDVKGFYERNRQLVLSVFIVFGFIFFVFYWTNDIISAKVNDYKAKARQSYERLEKVTELVAAIKISESKRNLMSSGLLSFLQNTASADGIGTKLVNIRALPASSGLEQASLRFEGIYYDELINFISKIEVYDNIRIKSLSFSRRYDNQRIIDINLEIIKS